MTTYAKYKGTYKVTYQMGSDGVVREVKRKELPVISEDDPRFTGWLGAPTRKDKAEEEEELMALITVAPREPRESVTMKSRACDIL